LEEDVMDNSNVIPAKMAKPTRTRRAGELSYKFQRLRERLRQAVTSGELSGKLPGERVLAKKYNCNAKTLSKALTDLAAEGLLDRSIGRGTYVKGSSPVVPEVGPWLVLGDGSAVEGQLVRAFLQFNPRCQLVVGEPQKRPSFVNQFSGVIDASLSTPEDFLRDLVVRGIPVVVVGREPRTYSLDCVMVDQLHGVTRLTRDLLAQGHRHFVAVEPLGRAGVSESLRQVLAKPSLGCTINAVSPREVILAVRNGATALVCDSEDAATQALALLGSAGIDVPAQVSVVAVSFKKSDDPATTGCYVAISQIADSVARLLRETATRRPATLWQAPVHVDRLSTAAVSQSNIPQNLALDGLTLPR